MVNMRIALRHDLAPAQQIVVNQPDLRIERVAELKAAINQGTYRVDAPVLAERLLSTLAA